MLECSLRSSAATDWLSGTPAAADLCDVWELLGAPASADIFADLIDVGCNIDVLGEVFLGIAIAGDNVDEDLIREVRRSSRAPV